MINDESGDDGRVVEFTPHRPTVGEWLREARESYGLKLADVSSTLRIRQAYLEALEADRFEDLPGATYAIGFLRAYSEYLGLDGVALVQRFREQAGEDHGEEELSFPVPKSDTRVPRGAILLVSLALAVVAYGAWYMLQEDETPVVTEAAAPPPVETDRVAPAARESAPAPANIAAQAGEETPPAAGTSARTASAAEPPTAAPTPAETAPATAAAPETATAEPDPAAAAPAAETETATAVSEATEAAAAATETAAPATETATTAPATAEPEMPVEPKPKPKPAAPARAETAPAAAPTQTASAPPAPPAAPAAPAAIQAGEIVIRAQVDSWVEVRDADNAPLVSRLLRAGDEYEIPAGQGLKLVTGNAGALSVFVDGNEVPPLAPPGAVRRYIALDAERLRQGTALIE